MQTKPTVPPPKCPKCGSSRTSVTGKSETPPMTYMRCGACGYITTIVTR